MLKASSEARSMNLTYASRCGNPDCQRGQLPAGSEVILQNKRIYCGPECAEAHSSASARPSRRASTKKVAAQV